MNKVGGNQLLKEYHMTYKKIFLKVVVFLLETYGI